MQQVVSRLLAGEDVREEVALRDLDPIFLGKEQPAFGRHLFLARAEAGAEIGHRVDQLVGAEKPPTLLGHTVVDRTHVGPGESVPHRPQETVHDFRARCLDGIPPGLRRPGRQERGASRIHRTGLPRVSRQALPGRPRRQTQSVEGARKLRDCRGRGSGRAKRSPLLLTQPFHVPTVSPSPMVARFVIEDRRFGLNTGTRDFRSILAFS